MTQNALFANMPASVPAVICEHLCFYSNNQIPIKRHGIRTRENEEFNELSFEDEVGTLVDPWGAKFGEEEEVGTLVGPWGAKFGGQTTL